MAKVTGALFSMSARGSVGKCLTFAFWKGIQYCREWFIPANPQSTGQVNIRACVELASKGWTGVATEPQRTAYGVGAEGEAYSGFNLFMQRAIDAYMDDPGISTLPTSFTVIGNYPSDVFDWNPV